MRPNKLETAFQWFCMLHAVLAGFSSQGNSIYKIIPRFKRVNLILNWQIQIFSYFTKRWHETENYGAAKEEVNELQHILGFILLY